MTEPADEPNPSEQPAGPSTPLPVDTSPPMPTPPQYQRPPETGWPRRGSPHIDEPQPWQPVPKPARPVGRGRILAAVTVLLAVVIPGAVVAVVALNPVVGRGWVFVALTIIASLVGLVVLLLLVYIVSYVVSAAWHDAKNARSSGTR
jgi:hypothetical protein